MTDRQFAASLATTCGLVEVVLCVALDRFTSLSCGASIAVALGLLAVIWHAVDRLWARATIRALKSRPIDRHRTEPFTRETEVIDDPDAETLRDPRHLRIADALRDLPGESPPSNWQDDVLRLVDGKASRRKR